MRQKCSPLPTKPNRFILKNLGKQGIDGIELEIELK